MNLSSKIFVAGHKGLVGSAVTNLLIKKGYKNLILKSRKELNLLDQTETANFFNKYTPEYVFLAAAKVGGVVANNLYRADFIYQNLQIQNNIIHNSYLNKVKKLLFLGSSCIYPKFAPQPMAEDSLLTADLEYTNEPYAIAKIAGIKMCESYNIQYGTNFITVMPTNLYGINDNFDLKTSHVLPALMRKIFLAKLLAENRQDIILQNLQVSNLQQANSILSDFGITKNSVEIWGSGKPKREFLYTEDLAEACLFLMEKVDFKNSFGSKTQIKNSQINIGSGEEISIKELAELIQSIVGYNGKLCFNSSLPDGTPRKLNDNSKLNKLGWKHKTSLKSGIPKVYQHYANRFLG